jgi:hypothetical protein
MAYSFLGLSHCLQNSNVGSYNNRGFVEVLAASQSSQNKNWFQVGVQQLMQAQLLLVAAVAGSCCHPDR